MTTIEWLQNWYLSQCDKAWEHLSGIAIGTIDNPGWSVVIDLADTELGTSPFKPIKRERTDDDWVHCWVEGGKFQAACGPLNLEEAIGIFREWVTAISAVTK